MITYKTQISDDKIAVNMDESNKIQRMTYQASYIRELEASGRELLLIKSRFIGIPLMHDIDNITWYDDDAKFIAKHFHNILKGY